MNNLKTMWGESLPLTIESREETAMTAVLIVDTDPKMIIERPFYHGTADVSISSQQMKKPLGSYEYQLNIIHEDGEVQKFPDVSGCSSCKLPTITICKSLDMDIDEGGETETQIDGGNPSSVLAYSYDGGTPSSTFND